MIADPFHAGRLDQIQLQKSQGDLERPKKDYNK